jgi:transposase-like protein
MSRERKRVAGSDKLAILKKYLIEKTPLSDLCDQHGLQPSQVYRWQLQLFEQGAEVFDRPPGRKAKRAESDKDRKIAALETQLAQREAKLAQKNEVISELMEENVRAKKSAGEL